ncbi:DUF998 domain-containing protein [Nonomuraea jabiensis]|uniref:DUF998 domain-containing protein n=1 Tax=Nonomuraea jabiensis TaxID=882448 RepID=UPI003D765F55
MTTPITITPATRRLLRCGAIAAVGVPVMTWADGATRPGYSLLRHGVSQLGTGPRAWLLTLTFLSGALLLALFAHGLRRALRPGRASRWAPALVAVAAAGMALAAVVPTDPALGYPPGRPEGLTGAGIVHQVAGLALFAGLSVAALVLAARLDTTARGWARRLRVCGISPAPVTIRHNTSARSPELSTVTEAFDSLCSRYPRHAAHVAVRQEREFGGGPPASGGTGGGRDARTPTRNP